jgi:hypothetical protein
LTLIKHTDNLLNSKNYKYKDLICK